MENQGQYFDPEKFDFCIHRRKRNHTHRVKQEATPEVTPKKIKTLLPKMKTATPENALLTTVTSNIDTTPITSTPTASATDGGKIFATCYILIPITF